MSRLLPLLLLLAATTAHAQIDPTPIRDAHVVTVARADDGGFVFEVEGQQNDFEAALNPGGVLVVAAIDGLRVLVLTDGASYVDNDYPNNLPLLVGPEMLRIDGRDRDEVGVLRVVPEIPRGDYSTFDVAFYVCTAEAESECVEWTAARPLRRVVGPEGVLAGLEAGLFVRVIGNPIVLGPTDPPARPVRD